MIARAVRKNSRLNPPTPYKITRRELDGVLGVGCKMGEGWLLTAEMCELIDSGVPNIVCVQPFGCLPNHIAGKGTIRALREKFPEANDPRQSGEPLEAHAVRGAGVPGRQGEGVIECNCSVRRAIRGSPLRFPAIVGAMPSSPA